MIKGLQARMAVESPTLRNGDAMGHGFLSIQDRTHPDTKEIIMSQANMSIAAGAMP